MENPAFEQFLKENASPQDAALYKMGMGDYDYRAAFLAGEKQNPFTKHINDVGKLPSHPTFSSESSYSNEKTPGGKWSKNENDKWVFTPSDWQVDSPDKVQKLQEYFAGPEKNSILNIKKQQQTQSVLGYPIVEPDEELLKWFKENPQTAGMQWGAGKNDSPTDTPRSIVLNPFSKLSKEQQMAVAKNEAIRHFIDEKQIIPKFNLTPEQEKSFAGTQYGKIEDKTPLKQSILARILTGDESAGKITPMQQKWADWVQSQLPQQ